MPWPAPSAACTWRCPWPGWTRSPRRPCSGSGCRPRWSRPMKSLHSWPGTAGPGRWRWCARPPRSAGTSRCSCPSRISRRSSRRPMRWTRTTSPAPSGRTWSGRCWRKCWHTAPPSCSPTPGDRPSGSPASSTCCTAAAQRGMRTARAVERASTRSPGPTARSWRTWREPTTAPCPRSIASRSRSSSRPAHCAAWWPPAPWSWGSTWGRWTW